MGYRAIPALLAVRKRPSLNLSQWLLLDSRVVDLPMAYNPTFVILSSPEALIFQCS